MQITKSKRFGKQYAKLSKKVQHQFDEKIILFVQEPKNALLNIHSLTGEFAGLLSFNVNADVRVMYEVQQNTIIILVAIGTHSHLYR